jgi:tetratricopeptide (TPR) repeat protein
MRLILARGEARLSACLAKELSSAEPWGLLWPVLLLIIGASLWIAPAVGAAPADALFRYATNAYYAGEYTQAAGAFAQAAALSPADGTLKNLGNAEWQREHTGAAILAWEQALWLNPFDRSVRDNLRFARRTAQVESPDLSWSEVVSSWLPADWWAWVAALSLWTGIGMSTVPGIMRWRKAAWHQALAAFGLAAFLLSVPAHFGVNARSRLGFILLKDVPLRLTPTTEAQFITRLPAGEPIRVERARGNFVLVRASHTSGWVERSRFGLVCSNAELGHAPALGGDAVQVSH